VREVVTFVATGIVGLLAGVLAATTAMGGQYIPAVGPGGVGVVAAPGGLGSPKVAAPVAQSKPVAIEQKADRAPVPANLQRLPNPELAPPVPNRAPQTIKTEIESREVKALMDDGVGFEFWTYGGTVPGPMLRVRLGDTVELTFKNAADSKVTHSIDLHGTTGPGGGATVTQAAPGESAIFRFKAINPGVYVYHCATPVVAHHIANGMYGLIVVEPEGGYPKVDREFYVMQGEFYLDGERDEPGMHDFVMKDMLNEEPSHVVFNGSVGALMGDRALTAKVGETVRIFFGVGGPNLTSSFHVIGEIFDKVYKEGSTDFLRNIQTTLVPTGGSVVVEFKLEVPGNYILVDHSLGRLFKGGGGIIKVDGPANPDIFESIKLPRTGKAEPQH
jgi:nitrite reductase (NO-forming)